MTNRTFTLTGVGILAIASAVVIFSSNPQGGLEKQIEAIKAARVELDAAVTDGGRILSASYATDAAYKAAFDHPATRLKF